MEISRRDLCETTIFLACVLQIGETQAPYLLLLSVAYTGIYCTTYVTPDLSH